MSVRFPSTRALCALLALAITAGSLPMGAYAAMVPTPELLTEAQGTIDRATLIAALDRADVQAQLAAAGVDPNQARERVAALTDDEVRTMVNRIDQMPAGGDILGIAVFVFLVLLITDIAGYTDIFPFVKKSRR